jgi:anion-transporting  ArsA/GET3 family ATPase
VVVAGTGGVGKTTSSAALAIALAREGRRVCVLTVDPARRLADALGLSGSIDEPVQVHGDWSGALWAVQLDAGRTFDGLLERYGGDASALASMRRNPIYRSLAGALGGTQEYMAVERLHELAGHRNFDVVVVDTPPSRNAVDLLDAPGRLLRFLTHPVVRALMVPTRFSLRAASLATAAVTRTVGAVVGTEIVEDVVSFFQAFASLHDGFVTRAQDVEALLGDEGTAYVLVTTTAGDAITEARWFADQLEARHRAVNGLIVNRVHPSFTERNPETFPPAPGALGAHLDNLRDLERQARRDRAATSVLLGERHDATVALIPLRAAPLNDVDSLTQLAVDHL